MKFFRSLLTLAAVATLLASLSAGQAFAQVDTGSADFTRYVALGDSLTAGYQSGSLIDRRQVWSFPNQLARQAGAPDFQQPLISEPGIPGELFLQSLVPTVVIGQRPGLGTPLNLALPRPYNNLGIPGARAADLLTQTGAQPSSNPYYQIILRGLAPAADQALALSPTFISVWVGNNEVLGAVIAGTPAALTPLDAFSTAYTALLNKLVAGAPNAEIITANVPDPTLIPFATTVPPFLVNPATGQPVPGPGGQPIFFYADLGGGTLGQLPAGSQVTLGATSLLGTGFGIPPALAPGFPQLPNAGKPLPDAVVLTPTEIAAIRQRNQEINGAIEAIAGARSIPVADIAAEFSTYRTGRDFGGIILSPAFLTGGLFSFDGIHSNDIGNAIVANELIRVINETWDARIPTISLTRFFSNNAPTDASALLPPFESLSFELEKQAADHLSAIFGAEQAEEPASPIRGRTRR